MSRILAFQKNPAPPEPYTEGFAVFSASGHCHADSFCRSRRGAIKAFVHRASAGWAWFKRRGCSVHPVTIVLCEGGAA